MSHLEKAVACWHEKTTNLEIRPEFDSQLHSVGFPFLWGTSQPQFLLE